MKAYFVQAGGGRTTLQAREVALPEPAAGQVRVRLRAAGLNRGEFIAGHGLTAAGAAKPAGMEGAGEIEKLGAGVTQFKLGERVMGRVPGAFAEYGLMDVREMVSVPQRLTWEEAGAVPLIFTLMQDMVIDQGALKAGEWLLVAGVSSGVGVGALQTAKALGAMVIGTSGSAEKLEKLKALGLDVGLVTRKPDFCETVMKATGGRGADLAVNAVGGTVFGECVRALGFEGRLAIVGYVDGVLKAEADLEALHAKRLKVYGVSNKLRNVEQRAATLRNFARDLLPALADGRIRPLVDRVYPLDELPAAKARMESDAHAGKIVVKI
jgi:NADPH:quinone reductase-like Zn-dependent oxidoreductase